MKYWDEKYIKVVTVIFLALIVFVSLPVAFGEISISHPSGNNDIHIENVGDNKSFEIVLEAENHWVSFENEEFKNSPVEVIVPSDNLLLTSDNGKVSFEVVVVAKEDNTKFNDFIEVVFDPNNNTDLPTSDIVSFAGTIGEASGSDFYTVEIRVIGTSGLSFSGEYSDTSSTNHVDSAIPERYVIQSPEGDTVSVSMTKDGGAGQTLTVEVLKDGIIKKSETTTEKDGSVSFSVNFEDEEKNSPCFIATAAYGSQEDERLDDLRTFRDDALLSTGIGESLVNTYYSTSPSIADSMRNHDFARNATKYLTVIPASTVTGVINQGAGLILTLTIVFSLLLLSFVYGRLTAVLKGITASTLVLMLEIGLILSLGGISLYWTGFATIAVYILPMIFPVSIGTGLWILSKNWSG